ncbi:MAG: hypothetical protein Q9160_001494 [Pyrenula sp. 1 TL-2023]
MQHEPSRSLVKVLDQDNLTLCELPLGRLQKKSLRFWDFPFQHVQTITFVLFPPDPEQPGEMIRLWKVLTCLIPNLRDNVKFWPKVVIEFQESALRSWKTSSQSRQSLTKTPSPPRSFRLNDIDIALMPFITLRQLPAIPELKLAEDLRGPHYATLEEAITCLSCDPRPYGTNFDPEIPDDDGCQTDIAECSLWIEHVLDEMDGGVAASLRLERYANWSKGFEKECAGWVMGRPIPGNESFSWGFALNLDGDAEERMLGLLEERWENMRVLGLCRFLAGAGAGGEPYPIDGEASEQEAWNERLWWECYKDGGVPKLSDRSHRLLKASRASDDIRRLFGVSEGVIHTEVRVPLERSCRHSFSRYGVWSRT